MTWKAVFILLLIKVDKATSQCKDQALCDYWAGSYRCLLAPAFMVPRCPKVCNNPCECDLSGKTNDTACDCLSKAKNGFCDTPDALQFCRTTCEMKYTVNCPKLSPPKDPNARLTTTDTSYLTDVNEYCREGLEPVNSINNGRKICVNEGIWISDPTLGESIECQVVDCEEPPSIENAIVDVPSTLYGNKAYYSCKDGFQLITGQVELKCGPAGDWEGIPPTCKHVDCGDPPVKEGIDLVGTTGNNFNAVATYNCSEGWEYSEGNTSLSCSSENQWTGKLLKCTRVICDHPNVLDLSDVSSTSINFESVATYTCHLGHERVGGELSRMCQANRTWSGTALVCLPVVCEELPVYAGARSWTNAGGIINANHDPFLYKTKVFHECFYQDDEAKGPQRWVQECGPLKEWVGEDPKCGANSEFQRKTFEPEPEEAPGSWAVGLTIFAVIIFIIIIFIIMDLDTMRKHSKYMKANLRNFRRVVLKRWLRLRNIVQVKTTSLSDIQVKEKQMQEIEETTDEVQEFPGDNDNGSEFNFSTGSASMPSTPKTMTSFV